jgi:type I restriction enzyme S subunit
LIAIPNEQINLHYLYLVLEAFDYKSIVSGTTQPLITQSKLKAQTFSLPPLTEQMRIIGIVSSVDNVVQSAEHAVDKVKALRKSILGEVFKEHSRA